MKIAVGADHAGYALKERLLGKLRAEGHEVVDYGTKYTDEPTAEALLDTFLTTPFEGGRHMRRIEKINKLEQEEQQ